MQMKQRNLAASDPERDEENQEYTHVPLRSRKKHTQRLNGTVNRLGWEEKKNQADKRSFRNFLRIIRLESNHGIQADRPIQSTLRYCYEARMSSAEDSGSKCSSGPISSFTIQSILGTPSDEPRSGTKELSKGAPPPPPPRRRSLSVSSEEECSGGEDSADCFCSDTGHSERCTQHQPHNFSCLGTIIINI